jgi:phospholipid/cholesterol/gamma-HCH transport system substrate-binding protein
LKISNESKVGVLTAIAITILVLGYNYLSGKDDLFSKGRSYYAVFDNVRGVTDGASVTYNGVRIGQVKRVVLNGKTQKITCRAELFTDLEIPSDSKLKIVVEILGDKRMELLLGTSSKMARSGDTLTGVLETDMTEKVNQKLGPIAEQADSVLQRFNYILSRPSLVQFEDKLPATLASLQKTIEEVNGLIARSKPGVESSFNNINAITENIKSYNASIKRTLQSFERVGAEADSIDVSGMVQEMRNTIQTLNGIVAKINQGEGSLGQLATNRELYDNLVKTSNELSCLMNDINNHPDKYLPLPWGKKKRAKAVEESKKSPCAPANPN